MGLAVSIARGELKRRGWTTPDALPEVTLGGRRVADNSVIWIITSRATGAALSKQVVVPAEILREDDPRPVGRPSWLLGLPDQLQGFPDGTERIPVWLTRIIAATGVVLCLYVVSEGT